MKYNDPALHGIFPSDMVRDGWLSMTKSPGDYMAEWWYDNCTATSRIVFEAVKDICGSYRMMYGSDFGFAFPLIRDNMIKVLNSYGFTEQELYNMERGNAEKLFLRFKR